MPKNLVFCADGTWNGACEEADMARQTGSTNVLKLFRSLLGPDAPGSLPAGDEQERISPGIQVAKYLHGVGDSEHPLMRLLGGILGAGLIARLVRGYTFLSRHYEEGDVLFLAGFSRGAYTVRALAGLIASLGLLDNRKVDLEDRDGAYRLGCAAWLRHQRTLPTTRLGWIQTFIAHLPSFFLDPPAADQLRPVRIHCVAAWDTVGSLGIPGFAAQAESIDAFRFVDTVLSPAVDWGLHAVSLDELRAGFPPTLWESDGRITQMLFPGAHSDVGGGYLECGLSDLSLLWMVEQLTALGLCFENLPAAAPDPAGTAHMPWLQPPWCALGQGLRTFPEGGVLEIHPSIDARMGAGPVVGEPGTPPVPYQPVNLVRG